jgi:hypothetical protein
VEASQSIKPGATSVGFEIPLEKGPAQFETWLEGGPNGPHGAYFVDVKRLEK